MIMQRCWEIRSQMMSYFDEELQGSDRDMVDAHLRDCSVCRQVFETERGFLKYIRASRPLHKSPSELGPKVPTILRDTPIPHTASTAPRRRLRTIRTPLSRFSRSILEKPSLIAAAVIVVIALTFALWHGDRTRVPEGSPSAFALMAVDAHQRHLRDQRPLEIRSNAPSQVASWLSGKVSFKVELPNYQELSGQERVYTINGARLVEYKNDYAAYVAYKMDQNLIGLVITSDAIAEPSGGEEIVSKNITFHYNSIGGLKVITWSHRGLTYALVSDLEERGQQSCLVCHQGATDRDFLQSLKPN
jgi:anti-sigma factor RsiW